MKLFVLASLLLGGCYIHAAPAGPATPEAIAAADPKWAEEEEAYEELYDQAEAQQATPPEEDPGDLAKHDDDDLD